MPLNDVSGRSVAGLANLGTDLQGIQKTIDDWEDQDFTVKDGDWSGWNTYTDPGGEITVGTENATVVSSPSMDGTYAVELTDTKGVTGIQATRSSPVDATKVQMWARLSNDTDQGATYAIHTGTTPISRLYFDYTNEQFSIVNGTSGFGSWAAATNYIVRWRDIDFGANTYSLEIERVSDGTIVGSVTGEAFENAAADMDRIAFRSGSGSGGELSVYGDAHQITYSP